VRPAFDEMAARLGLEPHPEGGWFRETYRAADTVLTARGLRAASTAILFLVTASSPSRFHRLASDELWVFQGGLPLELATITSEGRAELRRLGDAAGARSVVPQALVAAGVWQAARVAVAGGAAADGVPGNAAPPRARRSSTAADERAWSLVSCVVTPGFEYDDFELAERDVLLRLFPAHEALVAALT